MKLEIFAVCYYRRSSPLKWLISGSGIYSGKAGALVSTMPGLPATRLLVARVPKVPGQVHTYLFRIKVLYNFFYDVRSINIHLSMYRYLQVLTSALIHFVYLSLLF